MSGDDDTRSATGRAYDGRLLARLWGFVRPYRRAFWGALVLSPIHQGLGLVQPYLLKLGIDGYVREGDIAGLGSLAVLFAGAIAGEFLGMWGQQYLTMVVAQRSLADLRLAVFARVQRFPMRFFDRTPVGKVVSRVTTDVDVLAEMFAAGAMTIALDGLKLLGIVVFMCVIDWRLAAASLVLLPPTVLAIDFFRRMARRTYREIRERIARINGYLQEAISGMTVIALSAREARCFDEFSRLNADHRDANHRSNTLEAALFSLVEAAATVSIAVMLWRGGVLHRQDLLELGTIVAFIQYIQQFFVPIRDFSAKYAVLQSSMTAAERIFALLDEPVEAVPAVPQRPRQARGEIVFDRVWFAYRNTDWVLRDVSFRVGPGEHVAIVGATGSGKTTLVKLLSGFYPVGRGRILVDGVDVRDWDPALLRRHIAVVLQEVFLFSGTLADNVTLGHPEVSRAAVERAGRHVHAEGFVAAMGGWDAPVRERGSNLSAGQRQLLAFARALAHDPTVLVLDEATSSVDPETEWLVQAALERLLEQRTAVVIAHRLSTIERADRIVVLHRGVVREEGTHAELLGRGGIYARLHRLQSEGGPAPLEAVS